MTIEFFNKRMIFEPKLIAIEWPCRDLVLITVYLHNGTFKVVKELNSLLFNNYSITDIIKTTHIYSHFIDFGQDTNQISSQQTMQVSLLKQLDKIIEEKAKCEVKLGKKQAGVKATTKEKL